MATIKEIKDASTDHIYAHAVDTVKAVLESVSIEDVRGSYVFGKGGDPLPDEEEVEAAFALAQFLAKVIVAGFEALDAR